MKKIIIILFTALVFSAYGQSFSDYHISNTLAFGESGSGRNRVNDFQDDQEKTCSFLLASAEYKYDADLKHGVFLGVKKVYAQKKCDCSSMLGGLCFLVGPTYRLNAGYYPDAKIIDAEANFGYRFLFLYAEVGAGYSISTQDGMPNFLHIGPTFGVDFLAFQASAGYSFRTEKIYGNSGAFTVSVVISPFSFKNNKEFKSTHKSVINSSSEQRNEIRSL